MQNRIAHRNPATPHLLRVLEPIQHLLKRGAKPGANLRVSWLHMHIRDVPCAVGMHSHRNNQRRRNQIAELHSRMVVAVPKRR